MTTLADLARVEREIREQARENFEWRLNRIARDKAGWADTIAAYIAKQRERDLVANLSAELSRVTQKGHANG